MIWSQMRDACKVAQKRGQEIDDETAKWIARHWCESRKSHMYNFCVLGLYDRSGILGEWSKIIHEQYENADSDEKLVMDMFGTYCINRKE